MINYNRLAYELKRDISNFSKRSFRACQCTMIRAYYIVGGIPTEKGLANHS